MPIIRNDRYPVNSHEALGPVTAGDVHALMTIAQEVRTNAGHIQPADRASYANTAGSATGVTGVVVNGGNVLTVNDTGVAATTDTAQTISGVKTFSGNNTHSGNNDFSGLTQTFRHIATAGTAPSRAVGTGAGTGGTVSQFSGTDTNGWFEITVGTTPVVSADIVTITFAVAFAVAPRTIIISPGNPAAAALTGNQQVVVRVQDITTALWKLRSGPTALAGGGIYRFFYMCLQ